ncbi:MAG: primosomal protein N' [Proteobacteria bacterium]|nr:primosomal protein N' [Pseudomonadota bacterium]MDA0845128.1 primosomal protein N' [Pseudomonadota bacterium]
MSLSLSKPSLPKDAVRHDRVSVVLATPVPGCFDYLVPPQLSVGIGSVVIAPFGNRRLPGIVLGAGDGDVAAEKLRSLEDVAAVAALPESLLLFMKRFADWTVSPLGAVAKMILSQPSALAPPALQKQYTLPKVTQLDKPLTKARQRVFDLMADQLRRSASDISAAANVSQAVITGMVAQGLLAVEHVAADQPPPSPRHDLPGLTLSSTQAAAASDLSAMIGQGFSATLLDGVTGSGKTEVYFEAVKAALQAGQQILILLPEIALSAAWRNRFATRFGVSPEEWHSDVTAAQKRRAWRFALEGKLSVVVGARSALFLPFKNLGLIIVDEEHEHAFKQEDQVIYQARDMAVLRARIETCPIILASATPSLESWVNAGATGGAARYRHVVLSDRVHGASLPQIRAIDLRKTPPERGRWLAPPLVAAMRQRLEDGEQSLLFLNRRGYAPLTLCGACGAKVNCPHCDSWMVAHRLAGRMRCHHCGHETRPRQDCLQCGQSDSMQACGPGVERLAEEVLWRFPEARFAVLSSDTVGTPKAAQNFIESVQAGEVDIIVGTQMAAKGHHFPNLTLVGVVDADLGLAGGDLRASERTFQMLSQVAGRAGRESRTGEALLQTLDPENPVLTSLLGGDRNQFLANEATARAEAGMPPFAQLAAVILSSPDDTKLHEAMRLLAASRPVFDHVDCFGPAMAPLAYLKGRHRARFLLRAEKTIDLQRILRDWIADVKLPAQVRLHIDIDPYSFL